MSDDQRASVIPTDDLRRRLEQRTPIRDAVLQSGHGADLVLDDDKAEGSVRVEVPTKHGELGAGVGVRKWYTGPLEWFAFASWRPRGRR